jgi:hypothetical protein
MSCRRTQIELMCLAVIVGLAVCGCNRDEMQRKHQENVKKWNDFWKPGDSGSLFGGHKAGDAEIWTIECNEYLGENSGETADSMATALKKVDGIKADAVRVEHGEGKSRVLYGSYPLKYVRAKTSKETQVEGETVIELSEDIKRDLKLIRGLAMGEEFPFFSSRPIPQPATDVGPPEWDLRNAKGVYTLNVGVTYNTPTLHNHKEAAVEWVRALREQGYQAYYYHAPDGTKTSICVGTFGDDALVAGPDGKSQYSEAVQTLRNQGDFQYNLENGLRVYRKVPNSETGQIERIPNWSFLVKIPQKEKE